jgi:multicomponent Na+:H+ antiporter subunit D
MTPEILIAVLPIVAALAATLVPGGLRRWWLLAVPVITFAILLQLQPGASAPFEVFGLALTYLRVDRLSLAFAYIFTIAAFVNVIYAWHLKSSVEPVAAMVYAGAAIGAVFAGDLLTLFVYWELSAIASVVLIWSRGGARAWRAGMRYVIVQLGSGMLLAAGAALHYADTRSLEFGVIGIGTVAGILLLLAFGIKCSFPFLHNWLQDAYPEATPTGTVVLCAFTTKLGIYALARGFPGTEPLIWIGTAMTVFPIFYAVIENDLRRVLAYSMTNQLGFMVVGIGIGTEMGLNGAVAHAFADILFKALLFMSMGAVLLRTGTVNGTDLGGLYKSMPRTAALCIVGAASISAFPLFSGFVTKSMIMGSAAQEGYVAAWLLLLFASAGVFHHAGIKIPYFAFFGHDSGIRCEEAPRHMLIAMSIAAVLCIGIGVYPHALYSILPYPVQYVPYTASHVISQLQLLVFSALAFAVLMRTGIYPPELRSVNIDFDWIYRKFLPAMWRKGEGQVVREYAWLARRSSGFAKGVIRCLELWHREPGALASTSTTGRMVLWVAILLAVYLVFYWF